MGYVTIVMYYITIIYLSSLSSAPGLSPHGHMEPIQWSSVANYSGSPGYVPLKEIGLYLSLDVVKYI